MKDAKPERTDTDLLFISYARADATTVLVDVAALQTAGVTVWYDDAIPGGVLWREELARRIAGARGVVCFLSANFLRSQYCIAELSFAIDETIPLVCVYLEPLTLTAGLRMSIGHRQALLRYALSSEDYLERLVAAVGHSLTPAAADSVELPTTYLLPDSLSIRYGQRSYTVPAHFGGRFLVGRSPECQLLIESNFISRRHGYFTVQHGDFRYTDQSSNGSVLKTTDAEVLVHGDAVTLPHTGELRLGDVTIAFVILRGSA
jgi:hypothetical protein